MPKDYYKILGVDKNATQDEIKKAFRKKAHEYHPDKGGGDEAKFKELNEAYQVIGDEKKRQQYDQFGSAFDNMGRAGFGGGNWEDIFRQARQSGGGAWTEDFGDLGDIFSNIFSGFGGGQSRTYQNRRTRGADIEAKMTIDFKEAAFGAEKEIKLTKNVTCSKCSGNGAEPGSKINTCPTCNGSGQVTRVQRTILGSIQTAAVCDDCHGEGKKAERKCSKCGGAGVSREAKQIKFKVPAGINDGETIRLSGEGEAGTQGGPAGDLYIHFQIKPDPRFKREGDNIISTAKISITQAALGDKIEIETIDGKVNLKIPAGTQSGKVFILKGKGITHLRQAGRGDHLVEVRVQTPQNLTKKQKEILEEFAQTEKRSKKKGGFWG
jgi:molecular chaperone DnaJ